ncbi:hypothetical protein BDW62DRAFT_206200 [Aspergillus aurantiobrunneus]
MHPQTTAHETWGVSLVGTLSVQNATEAKGIQEFLANIHGHKLKSSRRIKPETYDITIGYHAKEQEWKVLLRMKGPEAQKFPEDIRKKWRAMQRHILASQLGGPDKDAKILSYDPKDRGYYADVAVWEKKTRIMVYRGIPFLLMKDGDVQQRDSGAYKTILLLDQHGLEWVIERSKPGLWTQI